MIQIRMMKKPEKIIKSDNKTKMTFPGDNDDDDVNG